MKKIAITSNTAWYIYNFRGKTISKLIECGYEVLVITPFDDSVKKLVNLGVKYTPVYIDKSSKNPFKDIATFLNFIWIYYKEKPDLILNFTAKNNIYSTISGRLFNIGSINNIAGLGKSFVSEGLVSKIMRILYYCSQNVASHVFFQNGDDQKLFLDNEIIKHKNYSLLPGSGVDLERFSYIEQTPKNKTVFLMIARLIYEKGVSYYSGAAQILREKYRDGVEFQLVGFFDSSDSKVITPEYISELHRSNVINFLGETSEVEKVIKSSDCVVLPSFYREGVPRVLLEAAAIGRPLITTGAIGCREVIEDGKNGFICEARSVDSLVEQMEKLICLSDQERVTMGKEGRRKMVNEFDEEFVIDKYLEVIRLNFK